MKRRRQTERKMTKWSKREKIPYKTIYPSGSNTPSASVAIKAHKPAHTARVIISHVNSSQENLASHNNDLLKPLIVKSPFVCKNSVEFVDKVKTITVAPGEKMISLR